MSTPLFADTLDYIGAVTKALNALPTHEHYYIKVELRHEGSHDKAGDWSDEIGPDAWYFEEVSE